MRKLFFLYCLLITISANCYSQGKKIYLNVRIDKPVKSVTKVFKRLDDDYVDQTKASFHLNRKIEKIRKRGYWEANVDSLKLQNDTLLAFVHIGKKYNMEAYWKFDQEEKESAYITKRSIEERHSNLDDVKLIQESILKDYNNNGYPFAKIEIDSIDVNGKSIKSSWNVQSGKSVVWDTILVKGNIKISHKFISKFLGVSKGKTYKEKTLTSVSDKINSLNFMSELKSSEVEFIGNKAKVYAYLNKEKSNRFDGILGLQNNSGEKDKLELTGEINLFLENALRSGEQLKLNWKKYESESQDLNLGLGFPYLIGKMGFDFDLGIKKQDSTYLTTDLNLGVRVLQRGNSFVRLYYQSNSSSLISTKHLSGITVLPDYADIKSKIFGIGFEMNKLDYPFNPKDGHVLNVKFGVGRHKIKKNSKIPDNLYDDLDLSGSLVNANWYLEYNIPLFKKISYRLKNRGGIIDAPDLFANDLFKLGGLSTVRGFNENSFLASTYTVLSNELRFIPEKNTSFYLFWDGAYYKSQILNNSSSDTPWGIGFGLNFATKSGIFSMNYALGKQENQNLDFKNAKIHFGFVSRF